MSNPRQSVLVPLFNNQNIEIKKFNREQARHDFLQKLPNTVDYEDGDMVWNIYQNEEAQNFFIIFSSLNQDAWSQEEPIQYRYFNHSWEENDSSGSIPNDWKQLWDQLSGSGLLANSRYCLNNFPSLSVNNNNQPTLSVTEDNSTQVRLSDNSTITIKKFNRNAHFEARASLESELLTIPADKNNRWYMCLDTSTQTYYVSYSETQKLKGASHGIGITTVGYTYLNGTWNVTVVGSTSPKPKSGTIPSETDWAKLWALTTFFQPQYCLNPRIPAFTNQSDAPKQRSAQSSSDSSSSDDEKDVISTRRGSSSDSSTDSLDEERDQNLSATKTSEHLSPTQIHSVDKEKDRSSSIHKSSTETSSSDSAEDESKATPLQSTSKPTLYNVKLFAEVPPPSINNNNNNNNRSDINLSVTKKSLNLNELASAPKGTVKAVEKASDLRKSLVVDDVLWGLYKLDEYTIQVIINTRNERANGGISPNYRYYFYSPQGWQFVTDKRSLLQTTRLDSLSDYQQTLLLQQLADEGLEERKRLYPIVSGPNTPITEMSIQDVKIEKCSTAEAHEKLKQKIAEAERGAHHWIISRSDSYKGIYVVSSCLVKEDGQFIFDDITLCYDSKAKKWLLNQQSAEKQFPTTFESQQQLWSFLNELHYSLANCANERIQFAQEFEIETGSLANFDQRFKNNPDKHWILRKSTNWPGAYILQYRLAKPNDKGEISQVYIIVKKGDEWAELSDKNYTRVQVDTSKELQSLWLYVLSLGYDLASCLNTKANNRAIETMSIDTSIQTQTGYNPPNILVTTTVSDIEVEKINSDQAQAKLEKARGNYPNPAEGTKLWIVRESTTNANRYALQFITYEQGKWNVDPGRDKQGRIIIKDGMPTASRGTLIGFSEGKWKRDRDINSNAKPEVFIISEVWNELIAFFNENFNGHFEQCFCLNNKNQQQLDNNNNNNVVDKMELSALEKLLVSPEPIKLAPVQNPSKAQSSSSSESEDEFTAPPQNTSVAKPIQFSSTSESPSSEDEKQVLPPKTAVTKSIEFSSTSESSSSSSGDEKQVTAAPPKIEFSSTSESPSSSSDDEKQATEPQQKTALQSSSSSSENEKKSSVWTSSKVKQDVKASDSKSTLLPAPSKQPSEKKKGLLGFIRNPRKHSRNS